MLFELCITVITLLHENVIVSSSSVCYDQLGCFNNSYPWNMHYRDHCPLPASPEDIGTKFYLFSNSNEDPIEVTTWPNISFDGTPFNASWNTYFVTHGFDDYILGDWGERMSYAIAAKGQVNVLAVDWSKGAKGLDYFAATSNTRTVGAEISRVIKYIVSNLNASKLDIHLIGHSLGAHVCAYASNGVGGVYEITGLDSAQPLFEGYNDFVYLDKNDACFVYGLHTDARPFVPFLGFGFISPYADVDNYVNGGIYQPGCAYSSAPDNSTLDWIFSKLSIIKNFITCPHSRAHVYYLETIMNNSCIMWGHQNIAFDNFIRTLVNGNIKKFPVISRDCDGYSCIPIGLNATDYPARSLFVSRTHAKYPYCVNEPIANSVMSSFMESFQAQPNTKTKYGVCTAKGIEVD